MKQDSGQQRSKTVSASFTLVGFGMQPAEITAALGLEPTTVEVRCLTRCGTTRKEECGLWSFDTAGWVPREKEQEIGAHLEYLLATFRPLKSRIEEIRPNAFVELRCKAASTVNVRILPQIDSAHISGIAELGAALKVQLVT